MSSINYNSNINNSVQNSQYTSTIDPALFQSVTDQAQLNSIIKNMTSDTLDRPIKFAKPKYSEVKQTYEVLAPITNKTIEMPTKHSSKVRTVEPVFQQPIFLNENAGLSTVFKGDNELLDNIPLPTNSVINNLIKDSVIQSNIELGKQMQGYDYNTSKYGKTKYEEQLMKEDQIKNSTKGSQSNYDYGNNNNYNNNIINQSSKQSHHSQYGQNNHSVHQSKYNQSKYNQANILQSNQKMSEIPQPDVQEGEGLKYSNNNNSNMKSTMNKQSKLSNINNNVSVHPSKVHQSNMSQAQQSVHSTNYNKQSQYNNQKRSEIPQPDVQEGEGLMYSTQLANNNIKSTMKNSLPSYHESQFKKSSKESKVSNVNNNVNNIKKNPIGVYETTLMPSTIQNSINNNSTNITNNNVNNIKKNPIGVYETALMPSTIQNSINNNNSSINNNNSIKKNIDNNFSQYNSKLNKTNNVKNINNNPIGVYETALMPSTIQNSVNNNNNYNYNLNNNLVPSVHVTKVKESNLSKMSVEPKPGEYNIMNNKTTMGDYSNPSFPTQSNIGKNMGKSSNPPNPFK